MKKRKPSEPSHIPSSTYRLQLNLNFGFRSATAIVGYLHSLGIGDCYISPILTAKPGSLHGYDVTDHSSLNPELGSEEDLAEFSAALKQNQLGLIVDVVPNHMCISDSSNTAWWDVLENGPSSPFSARFDIDWHPPKEELVHKVLLPVLGDQYGFVLENQQIQIAFDRGGFFAHYYEQRLPLAPRSWYLILQPALTILRERAGTEHHATLELESILTALSYLPPRTETDEERLRERMREKEIIKRRLYDLCSTHGDAAKAIEESVKAVNGNAGDPRSFDTLDRLLDEQAYRLAYWRVAADEINYRRFFDINELAAIRVEDPAVFDVVHAKICQLVSQGVVQGLRIDHPDGLYEPAGYFEKVQEVCGANGDQPFYVVAEKILTGDEQLREWSIEGTTGYGFLNFLNGIFVETGHARAFRRLYSSFTEWNQSIADLIYESKRLILQVSLSSELNVLARRLDRISEQHRRSRDFTLENLRDALREVITCFPIYRTYVATEGQTVDAEDERHVRTALATAKRRNPAMSHMVFDFLQDLFLLRDPEGLTDAQLQERRAFVMRVQQFTGPVMAKGLEDTAFYRYYPLASLNEVGADPNAFGRSAAYFHQKSRIRQARWPHALAPLSTHDTKRGEDVRARINVLSEIPVEWYRALRSWRELNQRHRSESGGATAPTSNEEYLIYQTLVGTWPLEPMNQAEHRAFRDRITAYLEKALREAKLNTSWIRPNEEHEQSVRTFVNAILEPGSENRFLGPFVEFQRLVARAGILNSLSQVLVKTFSPGVPDFYQGTDLWAFTLVDPDNRQPVDYEVRARLLKELDKAEQDTGGTGLLNRLLTQPEDGAIKLYVTSRSLRFRRANKDLFAKGDYLPLLTAGSGQRQVIAFARRHGDASVIAIAGRFFYRLVQSQWPVPGDAWQGARVRLPAALSKRRYRDLITGQEFDAGNELSAADVFSQVPVAALVPVR